MSQEPLESDRAGEPNHRWVLAQLEQALRGLQYGQVILTVQDGVVVQVERTERRRFQRPGRRD
jgi:hypothetical protein